MKMNKLLPLVLLITACGYEPDRFPVGKIETNLGDGLLDFQQKCLSDPEQSVSLEAYPQADVTHTLYIMTCWRKWEKTHD